MNSTLHSRLTLSHFKNNTNLSKLKEIKYHFYVLHTVYFEWKHLSLFNKMNIRIKTLLLSKNIKDEEINLLLSDIRELLKSIEAKKIKNNESFFNWDFLDIYL